MNLAPRLAFDHRRIAVQRNCPSNPSSLSLPWNISPPALAVVDLLVTCAIRASQFNARRRPPIYRLFPRPKLAMAFLQLPVVAGPAEGTWKRDHAATARAFFRRRFSQLLAGLPLASAGVVRVGRRAEDPGDGDARISCHSRYLPLAEALALKRRMSSFSDRGMLSVHLLWPKVLFSETSGEAIIDPTRDGPAPRDGSYSGCSSPDRMENMAHGGMLLRKSRYERESRFRRRLVFSGITCLAAAAPFPAPGRQSTTVIRDAVERAHRGYAAGLCRGGWRQ